MKATVCIDEWKLSIFDKHLREAGFTYQNKGELVSGTLVLHVEAESADKLRPIVIAAEKECKGCKDQTSAHRTTLRHSGGKKP